MKYIRKCINEAVKLPTKNRQKLSLNDIISINTSYIKDIAKKEVIDKFNEELDKNIDMSKLTNNLVIPCVKHTDGSCDYSPAVVDVSCNNLDDTDKTIVVTIALFCCNNFISHMHDIKTSLVDLTLQTWDVSKLISINKFLNSIVYNSNVLADINIIVVPSYNTRIIYGLYSGIYDIDGATKFVHTSANHVDKIKNIIIKDVSLYDEKTKNTFKNNVDLLQFIDRIVNKFTNKVQLKLT